MLLWFTVPASCLVRFSKFRDYRAACDALVLIAWECREWRFWLVPLRGPTTPQERAFLARSSWQSSYANLVAELGDPLTAAELRTAVSDLFA